MEKKFKVYFIFKIPENELVYVGKTRQAVYIRLQHHCAPCNYLVSEINQFLQNYDENNDWVYKEVGFYSKEEMDYAEQYWIRKFKPVFNIVKYDKK